MRQFFRNKLRSTVKETNQLFTEHDVDVLSDITEKSTLVRFSFSTTISPVPYIMNMQMLLLLLFADDAEVVGSEGILAFT